MFPLMRSLLLDCDKGSLVSLLSYIQVTLLKRSLYMNYELPVSYYKLFFHQDLS